MPSRPYQFISSFGQQLASSLFAKAKFDAWHKRTLRRTRHRAQTRAHAVMHVQIVDDQCTLQFTPFLAACCVLHRLASRVVHRQKALFFRPCLEPPPQLVVCDGDFNADLQPTLARPRSDRRVTRRAKILVFPPSGKISIDVVQADIGVCGERTLASGRWCKKDGPPLALKAASGPCAVGHLRWQLQCRPQAVSGRTPVDSRVASCCLNTGGRRPRHKIEKNAEIETHTCRL